MAKRFSTRDRQRRAAARNGRKPSGAATFAAQRSMAGLPGGPADRPLDPQRPVPTSYISGDDVRNGATFDAELPTRPGKLWKIRRVDAFDLFMKGIISMPILDAVSRVEAVREQLRKDPTNIKVISDADKQEIVSTLREYAKAVVVQPKLVDVENGDPGSVPIALLTFWDLLAIMNATPVPHRTPATTRETAAEFRGEESGMDGAALHDGDALRGAPERVSAHTRPALDRT